MSALRLTLRARAVGLALSPCPFLILFVLALAGCASVPINSSDHSGTPTGPPPPQTAESITVSVSPASLSLQTGQMQTFVATVNNDSKNRGVTWALSGPGCTGAACGVVSATASASGIAITYSAPASPSNPGVVNLTATAVSDASKSSSAAITITAPPAKLAIEVSPNSTSVHAKASQNFTAIVQNDPKNQGVNWTLSGAGCTGADCGQLSAGASTSGTPITFKAPKNIPNPPSVTLTATSLTDSTISATAMITITKEPVPISVRVSPTSQTVLVNKTQDFMATVQNDMQNRGVRWTLSGTGCSGTSCGALSRTSTASGASVTYTAPGAAPNPSTITITATSVSDSGKAASASITVFTEPANLHVNVTPKRGGVTVSQSLKFSAAVQNDPSNQGVTWSASAGTFTNITATSAVYHAPATAGVYTITASSALDVTRSTSVSIGVTDLEGVTTYHNDLARDGVNSQEYALTTSNVHSSTFGKLFSCSVDAPVYPQPLWVANLGIAGGTHNVIFAATSHDTVYAFDADASPCVTYWSKHLIPAGEAPPTYIDIGSDDIQPDLGIVGTPVIDAATNILYVVTKTKTQGTTCRTSGSCHQRLHALSLVDGSETGGAPIDLTPAITVAGTGDGSSGGRLPFDPWHENQRPGLALVNNRVYIAWGSHTDQTPWHGWVIGFNKSNLKATPLLFNATPNGKGAGIWMSGGAPSADNNGNLYVITSNGDYDGNTEFGDTFLKLSPDLNIVDWMTPADQANLSASNLDLGSGGAAVLADLSSGPARHLLIGGGKSGDGHAGELYLMNRDAMGHLEGTGAPILQKFSVGGNIFATGAFWRNTLYIAGRGTRLQAFTLDSSTGLFNTTPASSSSNTFQARGATPSISSNGSSHGIVWALETSQYGPPSTFGTGPAVLHAYDATSLSRELWNSSQVAADQAGNAVKFAVPTVANGKVYVGTFTEISVYGLLPD